MRLGGGRLGALVLTLLLTGSGTALAVTSPPPFTQQSELTPSDGVGGDGFGISVAVSGNTIVVGASARNGDTGAVYVFTKPTQSGTSAHEIAELTASGGQRGALLGTSVAISGNTIVAGAPGANDYEGAAYVFTEPAGGWTTGSQTVKLTPADGAANDEYGYAVAISGNTAIVGSPFKYPGGGVAYVYTAPSGGWGDATQTAELSPSDPDGHGFGDAVAISGATIAVGYPLHDEEAGAVYEFTEPRRGWTSGHQTAELQASDGAPSELLGFPVAVYGNTIVTGAPYHTVDGNNAQGALYVFSEPAGGWKNSDQTAELTVSGGGAGNHFGEALGISGGTIVGGQPSQLVDGDVERGAAYEFVEPSGGWADEQEQDELLASDGGANDDFGDEIAMTGDTAVIGAGGHGTAGTAYAFTYPPPQAQIAFPINGASYTLGQAVPADWKCTDPDGPGLALCRGTVANDARIDTSTRGKHTFTVTATDLAGGQSSTTVTYTVVLPSNKFTVSHIRTERNGTFRFRLKLPGPGVVDVMETAWLDNFATADDVLQPAPRRFVFAREHLTPARSGTLEVTVKPNVRGRKLVAHHRYRVPIRLWVSFTPTGGRQRNEGIYDLHFAPHTR